MYKVIACDLDGTLLKDDKSISPETIEELKRLSEQGVILLPSTGRTHREIPQLLKELPFIRYALCCNGGSVYDYQDNCYIYEDAIPHELALKVLAFGKTLPVHESVVVNGERLAEGYDNGEVCDYIKEKAVKGILFNFTGTPDLSKTFGERKQNAQKFLFYLNPDADKEEVINRLRNEFPELAISSSGPLFIEINVKGVDKGKALRNFCQMLKIPIEESLAFGDAENDITMLEAAGKAVVMENGTAETKKHADLICASNNDDGVRKTLEALF